MSLIFKRRLLLRSWLQVVRSLLTIVAVVAIGVAGTGMLFKLAFGAPTSGTFRTVRADFDEDAPMRAAIATVRAATIPAQPAAEPATSSASGPADAKDAAKDMAQDDTPPAEATVAATEAPLLSDAPVAVANPEDKPPAAATAAAETKIAKPRKRHPLRVARHYQPKNRNNRVTWGWGNWNWGGWGRSRGWWWGNNNSTQ